MKEYRKYIFFVLIEIFIFVLLPAQSVDYLTSQKSIINAGIPEKLEYKTIDQVNIYSKTESIINEQRIMDSIAAESPADVYFTAKTKLFEKLTLIKKEFLGSLENKLTLDELEREWKNAVQNVLQEYEGENGKLTANCFTDFQMTERQIYNVLLNEFMYDQKSLRKKTDDIRPDVIADELSRIVLNDLSKEESLDDLLFNISDPDLKDFLDLDDDFYGKLSIQIDEGLREWQNAEREFLLLKANWEKNSAEKFNNDIDKWNEAYKKLQENKELWITSLNEKVEAGINEWGKKRSNLDSEIKQLKETYEKELFESVLQKNELYSEFENVILQLDDIVRVLQEGIEKADVTGINAGETIDSLRKSLDYYLEIKNEYMSDLKKYIEERNAFDNKGVNVYENIFSDLEEFWEDETEVRKAVYEYARNRSSSAETSDETERNFKKAAEVLEFQKHDYESELIKLDEIEQRFNACKIEYLKKKDKTELLKEQLRKTQSEYNDLSFSISENYLIQLKKEIEKTVNSLNQHNTGSGDTEKNLTEYINSLREYEYEIIKNNGESVLTVLNSDAFYDENLNFEMFETDYDSTAEIDFDENFKITEEYRAAVIDFITSGKINEEDESYLITYDEIIEKYKDYSLSYRLLKDNEAVQTIQSCFKEIYECYGKNIDYASLKENDVEHIASMFDKIIESDVSEYIINAIELYLNEIVRTKNNPDKESLNLYLKDILSGNIIQENPLNVYVYENVLLNLDTASTGIFNDDISSLYDMYFVSETGSDFYLNRLDGLIKNYLEKIEEYNEASKNSAELQTVLDAVNTEYSMLLNEISVSNNEGIYSKLKSIEKEYSQQIEKIESEFNKLKEVNLEYRKCEQIKYWAENEYLHSDYIKDNVEILKDKAESAELKKNICRNIKDITIRNKKNTDALESELINEYSKSLENKLIVEIVKTEYEKCVEDQINIMNTARENLDQAVKTLVSQNEVTVSEFVKDFVVIKKSEGDEGEEKLEILLRTQDDKENVFNKDENAEMIVEYEKEFGKIDALDFITSFSGNNYSIDDLILSALYLKLTNKELYFTENEKHQYQDWTFPLPVESMFTINFNDEYSSGRDRELEAAFRRVIDSGGEKDIARWILFSQINYNSALNLCGREFDVLSYRALHDVMEAISTKRFEYINTGIGLSAGIAVLSFIASIPGVGAWAIAPLAALTASSATCFVNADSLYQCNEDIKNVQKGYSEIIRENDQELYSAVNSYNSSKKLIAESERQLSELLYGNDFFADGSIDYSNIMSSLSCFDMGKIIFDVQDDDGNPFDLKSFYDKCDKKDISNIYDFLNLLDIHFTDSFNSSVTDINEYVKNNKSDNELYDNVFESIRKKLMPLSENVYEIQINDMYEAAAEYRLWDEQNFLYSLENSLFEVYEKLDRYESNDNYFKKFSLNQLNDVYKNINTIDFYSSLKVKEAELEIRSEDLERKFDEWKDSVELIKIVGNEEWEHKLENLSDDFLKWKNSWSTQYKENIDLMDLQFSKLQDSKLSWLESGYSLVSSLKDNSIPDNKCIFPELNVSDDIFEIDSKFLEFIDDNIQNLSDINFINLNEQFNRQMVKYEYFNTLSSIEDTVKAIEESDRMNAALYMAMLSDSEISEKINNLQNQINEQNDQIIKWQNDLVRKNGYTISEEIYRDAVVDSLFFNNVVRERQTVHKYVKFTLSDPLVFNKSDYDNLDSRLIEKLTFTRMAEADDLYLKVFGDGITKGAFSTHVGEAPVFVENIDLSKSRNGNILINGSGELNLIMSDFIWNSIVSREGYVQLGTPIYDKKFTSDNKLLGIELPTFREITDMVCNLISSATGNAFISSIDNVVYGILDHQFNTRPDDMIIKDIIKAGLGSGFTYGTNVLSDTISKIPNSLASIAAGMGLKAGSTYLQNVTDKYVDSMNFDSGFSIDWDKAGSSWLNDGIIKRSLTAGLSYGAGQGVRLGLGKINLVDGLNKKLDSLVFHTEGINSLNNILGTAASAGVEYLLQNETALNVLALSDFGYTGPGDMGILSLKFDDSGLSARISSNGNMIQISEVLKSLPGVINAGRITVSKFLNMLGYNKSLGIINGINAAANSGLPSGLYSAYGAWNNKYKLTIEDMTDLGKATKGEVFLTDKFLDINEEAAAQFASILVHEAVHLTDSNEFAARIEGYYTYLKLKELYGIESDSYSDVSDVEFFSNILKEYGEERLLNELFYTDAFSKSTDGYDHYFLTTIDPQIRQNDDENTGTILGNGWIKKVVDEYNEPFFKEKYEQYMMDEYESYINSNPDIIMDLDEFMQSKIASYGDYEAFKKRITADDYLSEKNRVLGKYHFNMETYDTIASHGCVLTTTVYMVYSMTGKLVSLKEANDILKDQNIFVSNGYKQEYFINTGDVYIKAVNAIAGEQLLSSFERASGESEITKLLNKVENSDSAYLGVVRVLNNSHATLLKSDQQNFTVSGNENYKTYSALNVINPWRSNGNLGKDVYEMKDVSNVTMYKINNKYMQNQNDRIFQKAYQNKIVNGKEWIYK